MSEPTTYNWVPADLDRCEHGRHSIDSCFDCPSGRSTGNLFLLNPDTMRAMRRTHSGDVYVRIGTTVHGNPIWVCAMGAPR
jgi:hypothetical protein